MPEENKDQLSNEGKTNLESVVSTEEVKDGQPLTLEAVQELIKKETQREGDRVRTEYTKKLKALETEKETLLKEKMTEDEKKNFELETTQKALQAKEQEINQRSLELFAIDELNTQKLPVNFKKFILGGDEETTKSKITEFKTLWDSAINQAVEEKFKGNARTPNQSSEGWTLDYVNSIKDPKVINANWDKIQEVLKNNRR